MKIVPQCYEILTDISPYATYELEQIEKAARTCYQSEDKITEQAESAKKLIANLINKGHEAMLEHSLLSVKFTCDRAIANELVRHRIASFAQESTRYCNYTKGKFDGQLTFINPGFEDSDDGGYKYALWRQCCEHAEDVYRELIRNDVRPEIARAVLPLSLKTELVVTANYREWRHIFALRTSPYAHPQLRRLMNELLIEVHERISVIFDDFFE